MNIYVLCIHVCACTRVRLRARMHVRIYYNVSLPFISLFPAFFMLYNIFTNQRVRKKFQKYLEKEKDIFGVYSKKLYFCIRFRERERRLIDILTETE